MTLVRQAIMQSHLQYKLSWIVFLSIYLFCQAAAIEICRDCRPMELQLPPGARSNQSRRRSELTRSGIGVELALGHLWGTKPFIVV